MENISSRYFGVMVQPVNQKSKYFQVTFTFFTRCMFYIIDKRKRSASPKKPIHPPSSRLDGQPKHVPIAEIQKRGKTGDYRRRL